MCIFERPPKAAGMDYSLNHVVKEELVGGQVRRGRGWVQGENSCRCAASSKNMLTSGYYFTHSQPRPEEAREQRQKDVVSDRGQEEESLPKGQSGGRAWCQVDGGARELVLPPHPPESLSL